MRESGSTSLLVTGPTTGVGKTTVALNLAIAISKLSTINVLLVDLDLRASSMQRMLGTETGYGTERLADKDFSLPRAAVSLGIPSLHALPCAERLADSSERLMSPPASAFFELLRNRPSGQVVIYDTPPVLGCDDVPAVLPSMEAALMVVEEGRTSRAELHGALRRIASIPVVATVFNKSREPGDTEVLLLMSGS